MKTACSRLLIPLLLLCGLGSDLAAIAQQRAVPLADAIRQVTKTYHAQFVYDEQLFSGKTTDVQLPASPKMPLEEVLKKLLYPHELVFLYVKPNYYTIVPKSQVGAYVQISAQPQNATAADILLLSRSVKNGSGQPLESVSVTNLSTGKSVATDRNGTFTIMAAPQHQIQFSLVSYLTETHTAASITTAGVVMTEKSNTLTDVVVTGYQTISKERSAGAYVKPNMDIIKDRSGSMNVLQRLDGLVPGLAVNNAPSASQNPLLIRGLSTIGLPDPNASSRYIATDRNPLFVVDGIPMEDLSTINPQDVADITVLKDATAASIWGSRASNGVIVVVTKRGSQQEKLKVQYDGFVNFQGRPDLDYIPTLNSRQFIQAGREAFNDVLNPWNKIAAYQSTASAGVPVHERILYDSARGIISKERATAMLDSLGGISNLQQIKDLWYRDASLMNHTLSMSGGGRIWSFYGSLAYTDTRSNRPGETNDAWKAYLRQDFNFNKRISAYLITDLSTTSTTFKRNINVDSRFYPYQLFRDANGNNLSMPYMQILSDSVLQVFQNRTKINLDYNPLDEFNYGYTKDEVLNNRLIGGVSIKLLKGLKFEGTYGFIKSAGRTRRYDDIKSYGSRVELAQFTVSPNATSTPVYYLPANGGKYTVTGTTSRNYTIRNQLVYDNAWNNRKHQLTLLGGQEAQEQLMQSNSNTVRGYNETLQTYGLVDYLTLNSVGLNNPVMPNNGSSKSVLSNDLYRESEALGRITSWYVNAAYTFNKKYALNASWRIDKSNLFGFDKAAQNKPVWSVGTKWLMSEETFMKDIQWLDRLNIRATYGITGNSPKPGTAASFDILDAVKNSLMPGGVGLRIGTPANASLTWESTRNFNAGVDFAIMDSRISGSIDWYIKKTGNLIGELPVNGFSGYSSVVGNFGNLQNKGIEISLNTVNVSNRNFNWSTIFTLGYNKNTITQMNNMAALKTGLDLIQSRFLTGYDAFAIFAYRYAGLDTAGDPQIMLSDKNITKNRNAAKKEDVVFKGTYQPKWTGGLSNQIGWKQFSLTINAVYNLGHVMRRDVNRFYAGRLVGPNNMNALGFTNPNPHAEFDQRWRTKGDEAYTNVPRYMQRTDLNLSSRDTDYYRYGDINVLDASFVKLRDITLAWSIPEQLMKRFRADALTFRLQVSNIMLWKANDAGIDPEFHDPFNGTRVLRSNQGTITIGAHLSF
ncbi:SusC/RagA family TonB-linked outer membrane protein [Pseudoflavitalea sp. G-6-1-2]|uniref:SusC/RagA family TonB-linked outer membrane protein n=1 Tax=Pseudoflavitalea sp. G-6-1-2 TaxID=2728841 RepID=UPI001469C0BF|nr:SusC/RagA family TonB-linked outer membrane protein [Pseudoflavitalea sp. G-6-1-2]NML22236.1 SusC/RagA family TonB-linked outer membrane protein [Pseudoflavitalea sp. G-6-1-2]